MPGHFAKTTRNPERPRTVGYLQPCGAVPRGVVRLSPWPVARTTGGRVDCWDDRVESSLQLIRSVAWQIVTMPVLTVVDCSTAGQPHRAAARHQRPVCLNLSKGLPAN